ncbi:MAG: response regulator [Chloroflexota bacterium]
MNIPTEVNMSVHVRNTPAEIDVDRRTRRVLIIEDETTLRRVIERNLTGRGLQVREAATVAEALQALDSELPDLILLDINLPDRTGWDVLRDLSRRNIDVPTIVVSAVRVSQSRLDEFHPIAYLPKPFPIEALLRLVFASHRFDREPGSL